MPTDKPTSNSIKELLDGVQADRESKRVFLSMPREEQLLSILGVMAYVNSQVAILLSRVEKLESNNNEYREMREQREAKLAELLDTNPDIKALSPEEKQNTMQKIIALATRPARSGALLDKVLSLILVILFVLFVTGRLP